MIKVGIVGSDNSHAIMFSKLLNVGLDPSDAQTKLICPASVKLEGETVFPFPDFKATALFGTDAARNAEVCREGRIPNLVEKPEDMLGAVDAVMVVWRHGGLHYKYALPFLKAGIPVWIDKPFTIDPAETREIFRISERSGSIIAGGSTVKYLPDILKLKAEVAAAGDTFKSGCMTYAVNMENEYGDFFFYSAHLVECALTVFGYDVKSVFATEGKDGATAMLNYEGRSIALQFVTENYRYRVQLNIGADTKYYDFDIPGTYYYGFEKFAEAIKAGRTLIDKEQYFKSADVLSAIHKSALCGAVVKV